MKNRQLLKGCITCYFQSHLLTKGSNGIEENEKNVKGDKNRQLFFKQTKTMKWL